MLPIIGPIYLIVLLFIKKGSSQINNFGLRFEDIPYDYLENEQLIYQNKSPYLVNDITRNNPIAVKKIIQPHSITEITDILVNTSYPISISGGRFSMGGQTASPETLHFDMRKMNKIINFSPINKTIRVETGIRWCDIQRFIHQFDLAIQIMQTYANFTVGGSLSVNVHGRYIGQGPLILSVREISLILADGSLLTASPQHNSKYFFAAIGGYGGIGIIVEAEFDLVANINLARHNTKINTSNYLEYFKQNIQNNLDIVMHNADIYPPHYQKVNAVSWYKTNKPYNVKTPLQQIKKIRLTYRYLLWAIAETPFGKWRREYLIDKLAFLGKKIHPRNYEAGYDVAELSPIVTKKKFWALQEYFIPINELDKFMPLIRNILQRYNVNALNISIRHALPDQGSYLAWATQEVFAFVLYFKQDYSLDAQNKVAIWTRELINAAINCNGSYYLPYQIFATPEQFHRAYPRAAEFFKFKESVDPNYRLRNRLWDTYYKPFYTSQI